MAAQATNRPLRLLMGQRERTWFQESRGPLSYRPWLFARGIVQANLVIIAFPLYINPTTTSLFDISVTTRYVSPAYPPQAAGARGTRSQGVWRAWLNAGRSRRGQAAGPGTDWRQHPPTPWRSTVPGDDTFLGGIRSAPPSGCPWCSPSPGTASARGRQSARRARRGCWSAPRRVVPETPRASPSRATGGGQTGPPHLSDHDTASSTCRAAHTTPATPRLWVARWPYSRAVATRPAPRSHRRPGRDGHGPPSSGPCGSSAPRRFAGLRPSFDTPRSHR